LLKDQKTPNLIEDPYKNTQTAGNIPISCKNCSTKRENYQLRADAGYWKKQHARACERLSELQKENKELKARIRYLNQQLYGKKTEKKSSSEKDKKPKGNKKNRGHQPGAPQHPRRNYDHLPATEEMHDLEEEKKICPCCGLPFEELPGTDDSIIIEVEVKAHKRKIRKKRYKKTCNCEEVPGIITAPGPPKLLPKTRIGISIWALILLEKYHFQIPIYRILNRLSIVGLSIPQGTIGDGLKRMKDIFNPIYDAIIERNLAGPWWQADETRWQVMELAPGKLTYKWYLWVFITTETVVYIMDPTRATEVIKRYFGTIIKGILLVDRYSSYKSFVKNLSAFILAFCWSHVRRDFLDAAKKYPVLEDWAMDWKAAIGNLFHLNEERLAHPVDSEEFGEKDLILRKAIAAFKTKYKTELQQPKLHFECKAVLTSLKNHWDGLTVFLDHPYIPMDNNESERKMRNPGLGRKNYYGSGRIWSAHFTAKMFSIFQTLIKWNINVLDWLKSYLEACAQNKGIPPDDITTFLPWNISDE
jgi:transposase